MELFFVNSNDFALHQATLTIFAEPKQLRVQKTLVAARTLFHIVEVTASVILGAP